MDLILDCGGTRGPPDARSFRLRTIDSDADDEWDAWRQHSMGSTMPTTDTVRRVVEKHIDVATAVSPCRTLRDVMTRNPEKSVSTGSGTIDTMVFLRSTRLLV